METPITDMVKKHLEENKGWISEDDLIGAIAVLAGHGGSECRKPGACTETNDNADILCGARSLVENTMIKIHQHG